MECYLCGAENSPDSDFCHRCDGQLLKISLESEAEFDAGEAAEEELFVEEEEDEPTPSVRSRLPSIRSAEHRRLHDALGLGSGAHESAEGAAVPKVTPTAVPMIGTRAGAFDASQAQQSGVSRPAVFVLTLLAAIVGILGYRTITQTSTEEPPPEIAFSGSTLPLPPVSTTPELRPWTQNELIGKFAPTFVTVLLYDCPSGERYVTTGVAVDDTNVVFARSEAPSVDAIVILSNLGNRAIALHNSHASGADVATTWRSLSRTLDLTESPEGEESFLISRDISTATTAVGTSDETDPTATSTSTTVAGPQEPATISIASSSQGDAVAVSIGDDRYELDDLLDVARYRAELADGAKGDPSKPCEAAAGIVPATSAEAPETNGNNRGEITVAET